MRSNRFRSLLLALLLGLSAFSVACRQSEEEPVDSDRITVEQDDDVLRDDPELEPEQRVVVVEPEVGEDAGAREDELAERERELAQRQAALDAREQKLREQARVRSEPKPSPRPQVVEREEPVETEPIETEEVADVQPMEEPVAIEEEPVVEEEPRLPEPEPLVVEIPSGTVMEVEFLEGLSSQTSEAGDLFRVRVASDISTGGAVGIPAGSEILGVVTEAVPLKKIGGKAKLSLKFTDLVLPSGKTVPIQASLVTEGRSETRKDAATIGGAAAGGAILGRVLSRKDRSKGAVIGAIIGAAAGAAIASRTAGEEVTIDRGTKVDLRLDNGVEVRTR
ncbi:MAG TPA: hypothetical protein VFR31_17325 [Thermoanaerobaculia bacterium]|nr:hypothetical protein [Thermoanaerobaculia bacterium]